MYYETVHIFLNKIIIEINYDIQGGGGGLSKIRDFFLKETLHIHFGCESCAQKNISHVMLTDHDRRSRVHNQTGLIRPLNRIRPRFIVM